MRTRVHEQAMLHAIPTHESSGKEVADYARPLWEKWTGFGTPGATTSFHTQYNKRKFDRAFGTPDRYTGERAMALGYATGGVKIMKFLKSPEGCELVGVDCSKPGAGGEARQDRIRAIGDEFLALAAWYSERREYEAGDVAAVAEARNLEPGKFATFVGFAYAITSLEFKALKRKWKAAERAEEAAA